MQKSKTYENNTIYCSAHAEKSLNFACLNKECTNVRCGCFKCMQDHHSEHLKEIKEFDEIKEDIKICLKESETIINQTLNFFEQALKYIQKIKEQFDNSRKLFNNFPSQMNRTEINNIITELIDLKQGRYQQIVKKMLANSAKFMEQLQEKTEKNSKELSNHYNFGQQEQQQLQQGEEEMQIIKVNVLAFKKQEFQVTVCPDIPFNEFKEGILEFIFSSRTIMDVDYRKLEYSLVPKIFSGDDTRTLNQLGFTNECTLYVKL